MKILSPRAIEMQVSEALSADMPSLFDRAGRRLPFNLSNPAHASVRRRFICDQPEIDYAAIHDRIGRHLTCADALTAEAFKLRCEAILTKLQSEPGCADLLGAVRVPFFLPKMADSLQHDIGTCLEQTYLPALSRAYEETLPTYSFVNHNKTGLANKLTVAPGSRHEILLQRMQNDVTVGMLFVSLTEYSLPAAIEQMAALPQNILLAGGYDLCAALIGSPSLLLRRDGYPPLLWLAGLAAETEQAGYHFEAYGYNLNFNRRMHFGHAAEYWASALVVLG